MRGLKVVVENGVKRRRGRPVTDPFYEQTKEEGVAHSYIKNIPLYDWEEFETYVIERGMTKRYAIIRFIQELPRNPMLQEFLGLKAGA